MDFESIYNSDGRFYHNWEHIKKGLDLLNLCAPFCTNPLLMKVAYEIHDIVCDPKREDNEKASIELFMEDDMSGLYSSRELQTISELVMATSHPQNLVTFDQRVIADIDLVIFGRHEKVFDEYEFNIRREYSHLTDRQFDIGRILVLRKFIRRDHIYKTDMFRNKFEERARKNLLRSLESRGGSLKD